MKVLSARPHHLGSPYGKQNAEFMRDLFQSWGYQAEIETYQVLFPTPKVRLLEMVSPTRFKARLDEPALKEDVTSALTGQLPVYNCWSADGDVTGELVFVNYGIPADYETLERMGIDVRGKIVIAKYGGSWRGIKPKVAQEHGAIGCLIYSDPEEDGYYQGDVYPAGPFKNSFGAQRGSVQDMPVYPGDPLTPGIGSTANAPRQKKEEAANLIKIPVLPISYGDAEPLLRALRGPVAPEHWRGALPLTYHVGPGPATVRLRLSFDWNTVPCYNVIAKLPGREFPDEWIVRGNHHDAWVFGANDPVSGMVALLEEARAVSELVKSGWQNKRTIVYCAWDGEEPSLIGSTEWAEHHGPELKEKVVTYINSDSNARGFLYAAGSHTLETVINEVAADVTDPQTGVSVLQRYISHLAFTTPDAAKKNEILDNKTLKLAALGSGSDYSPFIQHLGIPSLNLGFGGESAGGEYHSAYDSYDHYIRFKDPGFQYGVVLAKTAGRATLRICNADVLPFDFGRFQKTVSSYATEVMSLLDNMRQATEAENRMIAEKHLQYALDPTEKYVSPPAREPVPYLDFSPVQNALMAMEDLVKRMNMNMGILSESPDIIRRYNRMAYQAEQSLLVPSGLPRRPWYRHTVYAPGLYTGYGVKTLPGIREAIEERNYTEAQQQITVAAEALNRYCARLEEMLALAPPKQYLGR